MGETFEEKRERLRKWHRVFAWLPVEVAPHDHRWLEWVERRSTGFFRGTYSHSWLWKYRAIEKEEARVH